MGAERPDTKSLRLLPSGPDRVGDGTVRPTPAAHMGERAAGCKPSRLPTLHVADHPRHAHRQADEALSQVNLAGEPRGTGDMAGEVEQILFHF